MRRIPGRSLLIACVLVLAVAVVPPVTAQDVNEPPTGYLDASLEPPSTFYYAQMTDPEGDSLTYNFSSDLSCGTFAAGEANGHPAYGGEWKHGSDTDCSHQGDVTDHEGTITVAVSDGTSTVVCQYEGSGGTLQDDRIGECQEEGEEVTRDRGISIRFNDGTGSRRNGLVVFGRLRAPGFNDCRSRQPVNVQRRINGRWITKKTTNTNRRGRYAVEIFDQASRYRAVAPRTEIVDEELNTLDICRKAIKARRHRNRR